MRRKRLIQCLTGGFLFGLLVMLLFIIGLLLTEPNTSGRAYIKSVLDRILSPLGTIGSSGGHNVFLAFAGVFLYMGMLGLAPGVLAFVVWLAATGYRTMKRR